MLTNQHVFAQRIINDGERRVYQTHMCGLCHALGDEYGLVSRVVTNHDMILLNMLFTAQRTEEIEVVERRCPLNPLMKVSTNQDTGSKFAAAVAIELARISALDNVQDSNGRDIRAKIAEKLLAKPHQVALSILRDLEFETLALTELSDWQAMAENDQSADPALPSARTSAALFAMTARLAQVPQNQDALSKVGAHYGAYIYLKDALDDFLKDHQHNEFNPLKRFSIETNEKLVLSRAGLEWLTARLKQISDAIATDLKQVHFVHNEEMIVKLVNEPIKETIASLEKGLEAIQSNIVFKRLKFSDGLKAATFFLSPTIAMSAPQSVYKSWNIVDASQVGHITLAEDPCVTLVAIGAVIFSIFGMIFGFFILFKCVAPCLCSPTGNQRIEPGVGGYKVRDETVADCCIDTVFK